MEPLAVVDAESAQGVELRCGLDALGDDQRAGLGREADEGGDERSLDRVGVDVAGEPDVELDEVGRQLEDVAEAGEARTGVVDREAGAAFAELVDRSRSARRSRRSVGAR